MEIMEINVGSFNIMEPINTPIQFLELLKITTLKYTDSTHFGLYSIDNIFIIFIVGVFMNA